MKMHRPILSYPERKGTIPLNRRQFVGCSSHTALALAAGSLAAVPIRAQTTQTTTTQTTSPGNKVTIGLVGLSKRGKVLAKNFAARDDVNVAYLCDVNTALFDEAYKAVTANQGKPPRMVQDLRRILEDRSVDAVVLVVPDHWHALSTIWACQAGKHVYVEKPVCHSPWEGLRMVEAARKYERVCHVGAQSRSAPYLFAAKEYLDSGKLGTIHMVKVYGQKGFGFRERASDEPTPNTLDWDMWTGAAPMTPYNSTLHRGWYWHWRFSGGEIINDSSHQLDIARWMIGRKYPKSVYAAGGRFAHKKAYTQTPDTMSVVFEYDDLVMTYDTTMYTEYMLRADHGIRDGDVFPHWPQFATRIDVYGSGGLMRIGRLGAGWQVFHRTKNRKPQVADELHGRFPDPEHQQNFVQAVRGESKSNADIEELRLSTLLSQFANISHRVGGEKLIVDQANERFVDNEKANALLKRRYRDPWVVPAQV